MWSRTTMVDPCNSNLPRPADVQASAHSAAELIELSDAILSPILTSA
jgi:hypothetical protein